MRHEAEKKGFKASMFVSIQWDRYQRRKVGSKKRSINQAKGTLPRRKWSIAIKSVLGV